MARHDRIGPLPVAALGVRPGLRLPAQSRRVEYIAPMNEGGIKVSRMMKRVSFPIAVAVLCGVAACASGPRKTEAQLQGDKETAARVDAALNADEALYAKHIFVRADDGVVRLTGYVWNASDFQTARIIAEGVEGVTGVVNDLELNRNGNDNGPVAR